MKQVGWERNADGGGSGLGPDSGNTHIQAASAALTFS